MAGIDFVPDDYIDRQESNRTNFLYMGLLVLVFSVLIGSFVFLKFRQKSLGAEEALVDQRLKEAQQSIVRLEKLQQQKQDIMQTALLTAELIEPVPRSLVFGLLTNTMPDGVSLQEIKLLQKKSNSMDLNQYSSKYEKVKSEESQKLAKNTILNTLEIDGLASSDISVAQYIANLNSSILLDGVSLVQSKEFKSDSGNWRQFKLSAILNTDIKLTKKDVQNIADYKKINITQDNSEQIR